MVENIRKNLLTVIGAPSLSFSGGTQNTFAACKDGWWIWNGGAPKDTDSREYDMESRSW